jgi:hypothetical protein
MEQRARELDAAFPSLIHWTSGRRTVYAFIERQNLPGVFRTFGRSLAA